MGGAGWTMRATRGGHIVLGAIADVHTGHRRPAGPRALTAAIVLFPDRVVPMLHGGICPTVDLCSFGKAWTELLSGAHVCDSNGAKRSHQFLEVVL